MASIIEKYASQDVTLLQDPVVTDGKITYKTRIGAKQEVQRMNNSKKTVISSGETPNNQKTAIFITFTVLFKSFVLK